MAKMWIHKLKKGTLTRKAKAAGQSVSEFCQSTGRKTTETKRQCAAAKTLSKLRRKRGK